MLFQLSVGSVKGLHGKRGMCILGLQKFLQSSVISMYPPVIGGEEKKVLERFAIIMYDRSSSATDIDSVRLDMFACKPIRSRRNTPDQCRLGQPHKACCLPSRLHLGPSNNSSNGNTVPI